LAQNKELGLKLLPAKDIAKREGVELEQLLRVASGSGAAYYPVSNLITMSFSPDVPYGEDMMVSIVLDMLCVDVSWIKLPLRVANKLACEKEVIIQIINMRDVKNGFFEPYSSGNPSHPWLVGDEERLNHWEESKLLYLEEPIEVLQNKVHFDVHSCDFQHCMSGLDFERFVWGESDLEEGQSLCGAFELADWVKVLPDDDTQLTPCDQEVLDNWLGRQQSFKTESFEWQVKNIQERVSRWDSAFVGETGASKPTNEVVSYMVDLVNEAMHAESDLQTKACFNKLLDRMRQAFYEYIPEAFDFAENLDTEGQRRVILIELDKLGYDPLQVPSGGKAKLEEIVTRKYGMTESQFKSRWKELRKENKVKSLVKTGR